MTGHAEDLRVHDALAAHLLGLLRGITGLDDGRLGPGTPFDEAGLDSLAVVAFNRHAETLFPGLPKTLLFDCRTVEDVCAHLLRTHPDAVLRLAAGPVPPAFAPPPTVPVAVARDEGENHGAGMDHDEWPDLPFLDAGGGGGPFSVAIVGVGARLPGVRTLDDFWQALARGADLVGEIPPVRWPLAGFFEAGTPARTSGRSYAKWGAFLDGADLFDAQFFGIPPRDAALIDPQERLFLECAWHAMEDAALLGERAESLHGDGGLDVGVFAGVTTNSYALLGPGHWQAGGTGVPAAMPWSVANRVSYALGLCGPSLAVDTACSSSLVALHLACESLARGECRAAVAGGVNLYLHPSKYVQLCQQQMLSSTGRCRSFGDGADGFVPGEGVGAVVLKPLDAARRDGDRIWGVIRGSAVNHGGRTNGYTVPSPRAQARLIARALDGCGVDPSSIGYVEAHGTGTMLGDPVEIDGLKQAMGTTGTGHRCAVGSVKSNIGHLESAAGIAALVKVLLQMRHRRIAPSLHSRTLNPALGLEGTRFFIPQELSVWQPEPAAGVLRAGISSFGAGGANAHVIVEEAMADGAASAAAGPLVFPVSARTPEALRDAVAALARHVETADGGGDGPAWLARLAFTLQCGRRHFDHRLAVAAADRTALAALLARALSDAPDADGAAAIHRGRAGQGAAVPAQPQAPALAAAWVRGAAIGWRALWTGDPRPAAAPLYPFARDRHWVDAGTDTGTESHPFPVAADDFFLRDHRIKGAPVLPAAAYLHHVQTVAARCGLDGAVEFRNLTWAQPFRLKEGEATGAVACTVRRDGGSRLALEATSDGGGTVHFRGQALPWTPAAAPSLDAARAGCTTPDDARRWYAVFERLGIGYGPSFQCLERAWLGDEQAVVELRRRPEGRPGGALGPLDPAMLDGALQSAFLSSASLRAGEPAAFVPYSAASVRLRGGGLGERAFVHVRRRPSPPAGMESFDITLFGPDGAALVEMEDFTFRRFGGDAGAETLHLLEPVWVDEALPAGPAPHGAPAMLVFGGDDGLCGALRAAGAGAVWRAQESSRFEWHGGHTVEWDPASPDHPALLWRLLAAQQALPGVIVFTIAGPPDEELDAVARCAEVLRSLCRHTSGPQVHVLAVLPWNGGDAPPPPGAAVTGLLRSLNLEVPAVTGTVLQLDRALPHAPAILDEAARAPRDGVTDVRRTGAARMVRRTRFIASPPPSSAGEPAFAAGDVVVLTGGLGAIGRRFAAELARVPGVRIALAGRSPAGPETEQVAADLGRHGATAHYWQADCADRAQAEALLASVRERFGPVTGIIHCAGVLRDAFFTRQTAADWDAVLNAKVRGARWLDELTRKDPLKRFVLCSSLAGVYGNVGQSAYAYANAWLDRFAERREELVRTGARRGATLSIAWPLWRTEDGMQAPAHVTEWLARNGLSLLPADDGVAALHAGLAAGRPLLIPVRGRRDAVARLLRAVAPVSSPVPALPVSTVPASAPPDGAEEEGASEAVLLAFLTRQLAAVTGTPPGRIDPDAALDAFGLDSILVMELNALLDPHFPRLPKTALFESRSLRALARMMMDEHAADAARLCAGEVPPPSRPDTAPPAEAVPRPAVPAAPAAPRAGDIAIVGLAGRYPGADGLDAFWDHLAAGHDLVTEIPGRWAVEEGAAQGLYARWGGFLSDVDKFDPLFFGISPRDAERMDPQERLFLQAAWHAVEDAGYSPETLSGARGGAALRRRVGVIAGVMYGEYQFYGAAAGVERPRVLTNSSYASIANRVSFCLDLDGPSFAVDSMCSSSLTSIHLACDLLRGGGCDMVIAGGVNLSVHPYKYRMLSDLTFASTEGKCRSFGDGGDGYVPGEGVGAVLLRPLDDALRDGDHIRGVIRGSDIGHGARTSGFTVPNADAQADVIRRAFQRAGAPYAQLGYVEAHGTGTSLGDPIEIRGLTKALAAHLPPGRRCPVGSVKANIGHLESAAGMAALTKVLLQMEHGTLAPSLHADPPNRNIDFAATPFFVQRDRAVWPAPVDDGGHPLPRLAAVSSFGAGGSNAHLIVEEHVPAPPPPGPAGEGPWVFPFSARGPEQLAAMVRRFVDFLDRAGAETPADLPGRLGRRGFAPGEVAATLTAGRQHFEERLAVVAGGFTALRAALVLFLDPAATPGALAAAGVFRGRADGLPPDENGTAPDALARRWAGGGPPPPVDASWRKVPLPGYAFLRRRCWIGDPPALPAPSAPPPATVTPPPLTPPPLTPPPLTPPPLTPEDVLKRVARQEITREEARSLLRAMV
ncbi:acyl transferase domain-containing protein/NADP-dependent 3-hydroxy acid dehydrogenase YdfG [Azospirillum fermentarium]|uniref:SDR family NAD(P)-dependent oxidoreductase n=1 Tax=Azospirillum fermentarium TaxID=1233114 RepID=UPI002225E36B|nr:SDR family NAD(P)-dependent oxidoreductase [Azospirillum fermentarium]MCW2249076.1 acyl transferase domain-containing protein/NADP-dependent 3-hydroxy acid dehydrogenase YdfG [Azospirillum fermentarium]